MQDMYKARELKYLKQYFTTTASLNLVVLIKGGF